MKRKEERVCVITRQLLEMRMMVMSTRNGDAILLMMMMTKMKQVE